MTAPAVVQARDLRTLLQHYVQVLRFEVLQEVRGLLAIVRKGGLQLQLWQGQPCGPQVCRVPVDGADCVFRLHADLRRVARSALVEDAPELQAWGTWEFSLCDPQGNRLVFSQWALQD